jgi:hypothetical protein
LHRPPPEIRTLESNLSLFSKIEISKSGYLIARLIAAKKPAAPPPIIITRFLIT